MSLYCSIKKQITIFFTITSSCISFTPCANASPPAPALATGQTLCYDNTGSVVNCPGTGQDGEMQNGLQWPDPRFTDNGDETMTDNLSGLIWSKEANPGDTGRTWQEGLDYIKSLNSSNFTGHSDWRLPNPNELLSLVNKGGDSTAAWLNSQGFHNVQPSIYWSSSSLAGSANYAWHVFMDYGEMVVDFKTGYHYVWPVRSMQSSGSDSLIISKTGQTLCYDSAGAVISCTGTGEDGETKTGVSWPDPRFADNGDQTVTDNLSGLIWSRNGSPSSTTNTWQAALDFIKSLNSSNYAGHNDWRLPNPNELASLVNKGESTPATWLNSQGFMYVKPYYYWSSGSLTSYTDFAWLLNMNYGYMTVDNKTFNANVWPVRSGQFWQLGGVDISISPMFGTVEIGVSPPPRQVKISNRSSSFQTINSVAISGSNATEFSITTGGSTPCSSLDPILAADTSCTIMLGFNPTSSGIKSACLEISANSTSKSMPLSGTAIINGTCGSSNGQSLNAAPASNLCTTGTPSAVSGSGPWNWTCNGENGGTSATCTALNFIPIIINSGATFTTDATVTVNLVAPNGSAYMRLSNDAIKWSKWLSVKPEMPWKLSSGDGLKTVFVQFANSAAATIGETYSDTITLDTKAPTGTLKINTDALYTSSRTVNLQITATDLTSGISKLCLKESSQSCNDSEFEPFITSKEFTIASPEEGKKTIYLTLKDLAGRISRPVKASINLDTIAPAGSIIINGGKPDTTSPLVALRITAVKASEMQLSLDNGTTWLAWEKYAGNRKLTLPAGAGIKTIKIRFRDAAGNESIVYEDSIELK